MKEIVQRLNQYLAFAILVVVILYFGKPILIPVAFAALFAMLMAPVCNFLERKGLKIRALSTLVCVLILVSVFAGMLAVVGGQFASFKKDFPQIKKNATEYFAHAQRYVERRLGIDAEKQKEIAKKQATNSQQSSGAGMLQRFVSGLATTIGTIVLMFVYTFLLIYNKEQFEKFFLRLYKDEDDTKVKGIVDKIATVSQKYLTGRAMSISIIFALYAVGLTIVGVKNAILLAGVAAVMTVVPFVGTVLGGTFPVFMAFATGNPQQAVWSALVLFIIQTTDNYFIEPNVVGGEVNLNALTSIMMVIVGGLIWGVAGMILFLPLMGIVKIVCDHVEELQPIGYVLGEPEKKESSKFRDWIREKLSRKTRAN
jgi:predicted PurR-regulated permease PerM